jgi:hypothetical protein
MVKYDGSVKYGGTALDSEHTLEGVTVCVYAPHSLEGGTVFDSKHILEGVIVFDSGHNLEGGNALDYENSLEDVARLELMEASRAEPVYRPEVANGHCLEHVLNELDTL